MNMAPDVSLVEGQLVVDVVLFLVCNVAISPTVKQLYKAPNLFASLALLASLGSLKGLIRPLGAL